MNHKNYMNVTVERNGKAYSASYRLENGIITVTTSCGHKNTQLGSSQPESLALLMLGEMIREGKA